MFLLLGIVLFTFFQESTTNAVTSVVGQEGVVRKTQFPRLVIPLATVLTGAVQPLPQPRHRLRLHLRVRRRPDLDLAALPLRAGGAVRLHRGDEHGPLGALRALPRCRDHLARVRPGAVLRDADPLPRITAFESPTRERMLMINPLAVIFEQVRVWVLPNPDRQPLTPRD